MKITMAYPSTPDSAFALHALVSGKIDTGDIELSATVKSITTLNNLACRGEYDVTTLSAHAFAYARDHYMISKAGGIFGLGFGPVVLSTEVASADKLGKSTVAIAETTSSAYLAMSLYNPSGRTMMLPADKMIPAIRSGLVQYGLFAHANHLASRNQGLSTVLDLGEWWSRQGDKQGQPLPLHLVAIKSSLPGEIANRLSELISQSVQYARDNRPEALAAASLYGPYELLDQIEPFVDKYITDISLDMGTTGSTAIKELLLRGQNQGLFDDPKPIEFC